MAELSPRILLIRVLPAVTCMALIYWLSDQSKLPTVPTLSGQLTSIIGHLGAYFVLAILIWWALGLMPMHSRSRLVLAFVIAVLYGISDEWHQSFVPGRHPDIFDVLTDAIGAAAGLMTITWLARQSWNPLGWKANDVPTSRT